VAGSLSKVRKPDRRAALFRDEVTRRVGKDGTLTMSGRRFEAGPTFIGRKRRLLAVYYWSVLPPQRRRAPADCAATWSASIAPRAAACAGSAGAHRPSTTSVSSSGSVSMAEVVVAVAERVNPWAPLRGCRCRLRADGLLRSQRAVTIRPFRRIVSTIRCR